MLLHSYQREYKVQKKNGKLFFEIEQVHKLHFYKKI